jgi:hypothetical protein
LLKDVPGVGLVFNQTSKIVKELSLAAADQFLQRFVIASPAPLQQTFKAIHACLVRTILSPD